MISYLVSLLLSYHIISYHIISYHIIYILLKSIGIQIANTSSNWARQTRLQKSTYRRL